MSESPAPPPLTGFGNHHSSEAVAGALPIGQNSPQQLPFGLYAEQFSATAFTAPRHENRRSWLYRLRPSAQHPPFVPMATPPSWQGAEGSEANPNRLRWNPLTFTTDTDFLENLTLYARTGHHNSSEGSSIYLYAATRSMDGRAFFSADGEFLIVPQHGTLHIRTELGLLIVPPLSIALIPRGMRFQVMLPDGPARGYVCENHGAAFRLPELGPIGANGLANPRDFEAPQASFDGADIPHEIVQKYQGKLWSHHLPHNPFDVVAWHGNAAPYRYDLTRFNAINTVSFDHPDPSIFTLLTSPSETAGTANLDFVLFPPRWMVAEHSFRPPWFHRNIMSEFMGLITGTYDAKADGFAAGGASLHNSFSAHGPDTATYQAAINAPLAPHKIENSMAFMFESRLPFAPTSWALNTPLLQGDYDDCWANFPKATLPERPA